MDKIYTEAKLIKDASGVLEFIATDETLDRQGEVIPIDSWELDLFKRNPVLLVNHDYKVQNIVGKASNIRVATREGRRAMVFTPIFHGLTQLAKEVEAMVKESILNTVSVGFLRSGPRKDGDIEHNELMEISFVPVPANPSAERIKSLIDPQLTAEEEAKVKQFAEEAVKEGRELSSKNRGKIKDMMGMAETMMNQLDEMHGFMGVILEETDPQKAVEDTKKDIQPPPGEEKQIETPGPGMGKAGGRAGGNNREVKILQRVAKEINHALYNAKQIRNG
jgi:HK97 family phage prohead protease